MEQRQHPPGHVSKLRRGRPRVTYVDNFEDAIEQFRHEWFHGRRPELYSPRRNGEMFKLIIRW